nr:hypothetical protein [Tanacetum cinerariifolium]
IRTALHLDDLDAADVLHNQEIFYGLQAIGYRPDGPWSFFFKKGKHKFLMYPRFVQLALNITPTDTTKYVVPSFTSKVFANLRQYKGPAMTLLVAMLPQVAQTNPLKGPPIAPQADEPMSDPAHAPNVEEPIFSPILELIVQPNIASTFDPLLSEAQFVAFTNFEAQQHHDQATGDSPIYEHPPIPNPATLLVGITKGAAEATKKLNRDTMLLFHKRIKKLEAKVKTKSKRKLVISDSEEEEAAKDYAELEKLIYLAEAAVNEPSSFVTPSKTTAADSSQNEDISPSTVETAQILTGGKLDPSKISKFPIAIAQRSVQTFVRERSSKSTQRLDYSDVDFSPRDSVATDRSIPAEEVGKGIAVESSVPQRKQTPQEIEQERLSMLEIDRLQAQDEEDRKKRLADLSKSDSEYAKQVPATGPLPSIQRQRDLDDMIVRFSNTEWMILMARVKDFPEVAKEILGADVNDDNFSSRLQALVDKRKSAMSIQRYRAQQAKPMTRGDTIEFMRTYIKNMSAAYYSSGRTMEWANKFKGKMKSTAGPSLGSTPADEVPADTGVSTDESVLADQRVPADQSVPADTNIPAGTCVSAEAATTTIPVNAPLDEDEPAEESSSLRRYTRKKSVAQKITTPLSSFIPFSTDDPDAAHTVDITFASDDSDEDDTPHPIITDDPDAAHTVDITFASDESDEDDTPHPIITGVHLLGWQVSLSKMTVYDCS